MNSGYGIVEAVEFLNKEAQAEPITLLVNEKLGNPSEGVAVYLWRNPRARMLFVRLPQERFTGRTGTVYFVYPYTTWPQERFLSENPGFKKVWSHAKPDNRYSVDVFKRD